MDAEEAEVKAEAVAAAIQKETTAGIIMVIIMAMVTTGQAPMEAQVITLAMVTTTGIPAAGKHLAGSR